MARRTPRTQLAITFIYLSLACFLCDMELLGRCRLHPALACCRTGRFTTFMSHDDTLYFIYLSSDGRTDGLYFSFSKYGTGPCIYRALPRSCFCQPICTHMYISDAQIGGAHTHLVGGRLDPYYCVVTISLFTHAPLSSPRTCLRPPTETLGRDFECCVMSPSASSSPDRVLLSSACEKRLPGRSPTWVPGV